MSIIHLGSWERQLNNLKQVVCFLLGNSPASELYMPTFRNTLFHLHRLVGDEWPKLRIVWVANGRRFGSKIASANSKEGDGVGVTILIIGAGYFSSQTFSRWLPRPFSILVIHHLPAYEDGTECSETSAYIIQTPGNYAKENIQHTEHGESLKSR